MALNIKDPEADRLAHELAAYTGETLTHAVKTAVKERLDGIKNQRTSHAMVADLLAIGRSAAAKLNGQSVDHATFHYNEQGFFE